MKPAAIIVVLLAVIIFAGAQSSTPANKNQNPAPQGAAGAPDWNALLADDAAIDRMAARLLAEVFPATGDVGVVSLDSARCLVVSLLDSARS